MNYSRHISFVSLHFSVLRSLAIDVPLVRLSSFSLSLFRSLSFASIFAAAFNRKKSCFSFVVVIEFRREKKKFSKAEQKIDARTNSNWNTMIEMLGMWIEFHAKNVKCNLIACIVSEKCSILLFLPALPLARLLSLIVSHSDSWRCMCVKGRACERLHIFSSQESNV